MKPRSPTRGPASAVPSTLDDVRLGTSPYVTLAGDPSRYGQTIKMGPQTYTSPIDRKTYTLPDVTGYVHDTGSAFRGRPDKLDVAAGDYRGWSPQAASAAVTADAGRRTVTPLEGDEADRAMRPIGMPEPWRATGAGESPTDTAVASGPPPQGRKMPTSLMDMFQPRDPAGEPKLGGGAVSITPRRSMPLCRVLLLVGGIGAIAAVMLATLSGAPNAQAAAKVQEGILQGAVRHADERSARRHRQGRVRWREGRG